MKTSTQRLFAACTCIGLLFCGPSMGIAADGKTPAERRDHITKTVKATADRPITVTSGHRENSEAHKRGAIDIRSKDIPAEKRHQEAKEISQALGKGHTVVVEEVHRVDYSKGHQGPEGQTNTSYRDGQKGNTRTGEIKATETHTHIQPDRDKSTGSKASKASKQ